VFLPSKASRAIDGHINVAHFDSVMVYNEIKVGGWIFLQLKCSRPPTYVQKEINSTDPQTVERVEGGNGDVC